MTLDEVEKYLTRKGRGGVRKRVRKINELPAPPSVQPEKHWRYPRATAPNCYLGILQVSGNSSSMGTFLSPTLAGLKRIPSIT